MFIICVALPETRRVLQMDSPLTPFSTTQSQRWEKMMAWLKCEDFCRSNSLPTAAPCSFMVPMVCLSFPFVVPLLKCKKALQKQEWWKCSAIKFHFLNLLEPSCSSSNTVCALTPWCYCGGSCIYLFEGCEPESECSLSSFCVNIFIFFTSTRMC